jgi:hypothetical protein
LFGRKFTQKAGNPGHTGKRNFAESQQFAHERCDCGDKFEDGWQALIYAQRGVSTG